VPRAEETATRAPRRWARALLIAALALGASPARAASERIVLGTHDATLAAALSVAVSPRGLSVVELPEPLRAAADVAIARREVALPGTVAVVWLCDDPTAGRALCFCGGDGRLIVKPTSVTTPLAPPDAAALALSVKVLLGPPTPARPEAPLAAPPPVAPPPSLSPPAPPAAPITAPPAWAVELDVGARLQSPASQHVGLRLGARAALAPEAWRRALAVGLGAAAGPALDAAAPAGRTVSDWSLAAFARARLPLRPLWLELDAGPSLHFLSAAAGASAPRRADVALDALGGAVVPVGRALLGLRAGGFVVLTSPSGSDARVALPRWNGEAMLTIGAALR
jgi:hypothetical protein